MAGHSWALLPSVLIVEILSYLSLSERLKASQSCKRWRSVLFQPKLWPRISLTLHKNRRSRNNFLTEVCGRFVRECAIKFDPHDVYEVRDCLNILSTLKENRTIQVLELQPVSSHFLWTETLTSARLIQDIEDIIKGCRKLKHLSLGFSEELLAYSSSLVEQLSTRHARHLEALHLASVKEDSETYGIVDLNVEQLKTFSNLKHLSIDYDHVDSKLLEGLSLGRETALQSLVIHIHGVDPEHEIIPNSRWQQFSNCNQNVEITLNLVHSYIAVNNLLNILKPSLPLAHYRQFFCSKINNAALGLMASHYSRCLKSVYIIDGYEEDFPVAYDSATNEDPFVMLAWKCLHLNSFSLIGYEIMDEDVIAIARLRSQSLKQLHIPHGCIVDGKTLTVGQPSLEFSDMISATLCRPWRPLYNEELPMVVFDEFADAEEAYNNIFLDDQKYRKA